MPRYARFDPIVDGAGRAIIRATALPRRTTREGTPIDINFLVERLESQIATGRRLPGTKSVIIDRDAALDLIEELRATIPEEIRAAKRINSEGERIVEKAQDEADRTVARAQEQAAFLIEERGLLQIAEAQGRRIIGQAEVEAEEVRRGADEYAVSVLVGLEGDVVRTLQSIKKGIAMLDERRPVVADEGGYDVAAEAEGIIEYEESEPQPARW